MERRNRAALISYIAEAKIRISRGQGLFYEIRNAALLAASMKVLFELNIFESAAIAVLAIMLFFLVGWFDLKYIKLFQKESELGTGKYNPHLQKIDKILAIKSFKQ